MKTVGKVFEESGLRAKFDAAIAAGEVLREQRIRHYRWDVDCDCDLCGDTGIIPDKSTPDKSTFCSCKPGREKQWHREMSAKWQEICPEKFLNFRVGSHPDEEAASKVMRWVKSGFDERRNLILSGPVGTGKSGLAIGAMYEIHKRRIRCKFNTFSMLLDQLRPRNDDDKSAKRENLDSLIRTGLLVIDDLGTHKESEWTAEQLFELINGRTSHARPFIITTNWTNDEMKAALDDRLMSRLAEATDIVPVVGPDLRRQGRAA